jgi:polysaccharide deacetylase 2 family uncharacterized protein YibQ
VLRGSEIVTQFRLDEQKTSLTVLMVVLALSSLGFAVLGLVLGSDKGLNLADRHNEELVVVRPEVPDLSSLADVWADLGFTPLQRHQFFYVQRSSSRSSEALVQGQETLVLVPERHDLKLSRAILQLVGLFLEEGWTIQLEAQEQGYVLGFWSRVPGLDDKVLAYEWHIELLNPKNYDYYYGGAISVMGQAFDPQGYRKGTPEAPVVALIIDDWGYSTQAAEPLMAYPLPLTMAVLPQLDLSRETGERLHAAGHEVILHQPMEALNSSLDLGPGGILQGMESSEVKELLKENLASLPVAVGLNNHMGSLVTSDSEMMLTILDIVKELELFFVDSRTSTDSVVSEVARQVGVPFGVNNLFIDNESDTEKIKTQVREGLALAQKRGRAVMIGHVRPATALALWEMIPELLDSGVQFVPISRLLYHD